MNEAYPVPDDLLAALEQHPEAAARFDRLAISHQREYVRWIEEAKREATRQRRIAKTIEMLKNDSKAR